MVLDALGGRKNVLTNTVCMTRLRVTLAKPQAVDYDALNDVPSVLGTATRGSNGLEVVFGPRMIDGIYHSFIALTGIAPSTDALFPMSRQNSNMSVQINAGSRHVRDELAREDKPLLDDADFSILDDLFGSEGNELGTSANKRQILILNGPNINMFGLNDPTSVSAEDFSALLAMCHDAAMDVGFDRCVCFQSNHEGDLIDQIQDALGIYDAIVINPGTSANSVPLSEALRLVGIPFEWAHLDLESSVQDGFASYHRAIINLALQLGLDT